VPERILAFHPTRCLEVEAGFLYFAIAIEAVTLAPSPGASGTQGGRRRTPSFPTRPHTVPGRRFLRRKSRQGAYHLISRSKAGADRR